MTWCSFEDPELYMRRSERRKRGSFDFVKEGKLQKQAQIGRLRVCHITSACVLCGQEPNCSPYLELCFVQHGQIGKLWVHLLSLTGQQSQPC